MNSPTPAHVAPGNAATSRTPRRSALPGDPAAGNALEQPAFFWS